MINNTKKKQNLKFLLLTLALIFLSPWLYKLFFTVVGLNIHELSYVVVAISAILISLLCIKLNANRWLLFGCLLLLPPIAWELMSFISFEIDYSNNAVHIPPSDFLPEGERYRDFASYYDFSYGNEYWNGYTRLLKHEIIWIIVPFLSLLLHNINSKKNHSMDLLDQ